MSPHLTKNHCLWIDPSPKFLSGLSIFGSRAQTSQVYYFRAAQHECLLSGASGRTIDCPLPSYKTRRSFSQITHITTTHSSPLPKSLSMACMITVIVPVFEVSYEVDVTMDMLVRELKAELEVLTGLPIGKKR